MPSIAVIGASKDHNKFGNKCIRAYLDEGYTVFPVNPKETEIEGLECFRSIKDIKSQVDIASVYLQPEVGLMIAKDIIAKKVKTVYLNPSTQSLELISKLEKAGIEVRPKCSIVAIGRSPSEYS